MLPNLLITVLALGAPALKEKPNKTTIVGVWVAEECLVSGKPGEGLKTGETLWAFHADGTQTISKDGKMLVTGTYTVESKKGPATLDLLRDAPSIMYPCIYKIDGDTLTLNVGWEKALRPTSFESPTGSKCTLYVFKRVKLKD